MITSTLSTFLSVFIVISLTIATSMKLTKLVPWSFSAVEANLNTSFAIGTSPFILGLTTILVMRILPGSTHFAHLTALIITLSMLLGICLYFQKSTLTHLTKRQDSATSNNRRWYILLSAYITFLLLNSVLFTLTQNDPLEYATVGRLLYQTRDLSAYPAIHPELTASGFYGPWTHPPLYPALIYFSYLLQKSSDYPGLLRLISPWCLILATYLVYSLGKLTNKTTGLLSAIFFISAPLLFFGADSASIDPLPVLGITLLMVCVIGTDLTRRVSAIVIGLVLGASLWTHSQAILFIPLTLSIVFFRLGWRNIRKVITQTFIIFTIAIVVAAPPYLLNYHLFGALISDTPRIFALPVLGWDEYFQIARGLDNPIAKIQYGILKGWFTLEAYSITYWVMLISLVIYAYLRYTKNDEQLLKKSDWLIPIIGIITTYIGGVLLSVFLGIDLMIRNERYWLVILPFVSLLAAWGCAYIFSNTKRYNILSWLLFAFFCSELVVLVSYKLLINDAISTAIETHQILKLKTNSQMSVIEYLKNKTPKDALVLSMRPADMYYSSRKMISYLDPTMTDFYQTQSVEDGWKLLLSKGIQYIHIPYYYIPPIYNSVLQEILADPQLTKLEIDSDGNQIYSLQKKPDSSRTFKSTTVDFSPTHLPWYQSSQIIFGGRKNLLSLTLQEPDLSKTGESNTEHFRPFFQRDWSTTLETQYKQLDDHAICLPLQENHETQIKLDLEGNAFVRVYIYQYDQNRTLLRSPYPNAKYRSHIGEIVLGKNHPHIQFSRRFIPLPKAKCLTVTIEHLGMSHIKLKSATISQLT